MWGRFDGGELVAACHVGANLVPVEARPDDARAFAERALTRSRSVSTIVGPHEAVEVFWNTVAGQWGRPRELRWQQPHLEIDHDPLVEGHPDARRTTRADLDLLYPACVAMYTEEVGVSPELGGGADLYRARVQQLISRGGRSRGSTVTGWCSRPRSPVPRRTPRRSRASSCPRTGAAKGWR